MEQAKEPPVPTHPAVLTVSPAAPADTRDSDSSLSIAFGSRGNTTCMVSSVSATIRASTPEGGSIPSFRSSSAPASPERRALSSASSPQRSASRPTRA